MADLLRMPEVATGTTSARVAEWLVTERTPFAAATPLASIETDKAAIDLAAEDGGVLVRILAAPGDDVPVGAPIALIAREQEADGLDVEAALAALLGGAAPAAAPPTGAGGPTGAAEPTPAPAPAAAAAAAVAPGWPVPDPGRPRRTFISPVARRLAERAGIDPATIEGTGPGGRVQRADVERAVAAAAAAAAAAPAPAPTPAPAAPTPAPPAPAPAPAPASGPRPAAAGDLPAWAARAEVLPHSRMRRAIATRLAASTQSVPHFYVRASARVDALLELRAELADRAGTKVSVNDLVVKAVARAHAAVPECNVVWTDDALLRLAQVDVGVAVATDGGLVSPVLRDVGRLSVGAVAAATADLAGRARAGGLRQPELEGGSVTVTNLGMYGTEEFAAIINPPQSMIVAVGAARPEVVAVEGAPAVARVLHLTTSVDHRAIDGALAARWVAALVDALESPLQLLV